MKIEAYKKWCEENNKEENRAENLQEYIKLKEKENVRI